MDWTQVYAAIWKGNAQVCIYIKNTTVRRGTDLRGTVSLKGGEVEQKIEVLELKITQIDSAGKHTSNRQFNTLNLASNIVISPQEKQAFEFSIPIPLSTSCAYRIRLEAQAGIRWSVDPRDIAEITIHINSEIEAVYRALEQLGFTHNPNSIRLGGFIESYMERKAFNAPPLYADHFDGVITVIGVIPDLINRVGDVAQPESITYLTGELIINRRERGLKDRMKSLVGSDLVRIPIKIPGEQLRNPKTLAPNPKGAIPFLVKALESAKIVPPSEKDWLLRPASAPQESHLLRPVSHTPREDPSLLLQPAENREEE